ncbi:MAG: hypothetical protein ABW039_11095 [Sphingobium sp.]
MLETELQIPRETAIDLARADQSGIIKCFTSWKDWADPESGDWYDWRSLAPTLGCRLEHYRDRSNSWYLAPEDGSRPIAEALRAAYYSEPPARPYATIGSSMGGYGAMLVGALSGADFVLAIGPQTILGMQALKEVRAIRFVEDFERLDANIRTARYRDIIPVMRKARRTLFVSICGKNNNIDVDHLNRIKNEPNALCFWLDGSDHENTARRCKELKILQYLYGYFLSLDGRRADSRDLAINILRNYPNLSLAF